jgi:hypothetical protein
MGGTETEAKFMKYTDSLAKQIQHLEDVKDSLYQLLLDSPPDDPENALRIYDLWLRSQDQLRLTHTALHNATKPR